MIRTPLAGAALLLVAAPVIAQNPQEALDARYARAVAAGYKALMLCSAIAIAERNGTTRTPESVVAWELTGIQAPHNALLAELPFEIVRRPSGQIAHVAVEWAEDMPARIAAYFGPDSGCSTFPIGAPEDSGNPQAPVPAAEPQLAQQVEGVLPAGKAGDALTLTVQRALDGSAYGAGARTSAIIIQSDGTRVAEAYAPGFDASTPQRSWSVAKSIAATLVGAAVLEGETSVDEPIGINFWRAGGASDPRNAITLDHALRMATGRYSDTPGNRTDPLYFGGSTVDETALAWPLIHKPGTVFRYANNDTLLAVKAIGGWLAYYPPHEFFAKLGMMHTVAETDIRGEYVLSSQIWTTAGDLAKFGQLYLDDGKLRSGERVLPEGWVKYVTTPSGPQPLTGTFGYGAGFWLLNKEEGVPPDTFAAIGNRGQYVVIIPSRQVVIVRRGEDPPGAGFDIAGFIRDVLAALPG
ncbi:serine hydrolase domain-containing protein [Erythrobacter tepidarius]|uniref:serine hydrolase domain-containing protein n=1 Tax=Erythrobacter tepidarius TaxID=60454 RepID=UPI000A3AB17E|nr:serine hydrolase [Erythrobacter tepidarius]